MELAKIVTVGGGASFRAMDNYCNRLGNHCVCTCVHACVCACTCVGCVCACVCGVWDVCACLCVWCVCGVCVLVCMLVCMLVCGMCVTSTFCVGTCGCAHGVCVLFL